jgi:FKBP-type peptidyl-prolyl cis-trans isomerase FkpA
MRNYLILAAMAAVCFLPACEEKGVTTEHGHRVINHTKKGGTLVQPGDLVKLNLYTYLGDSLMGSTKSQGGPQDFPVPTKEQMAQIPKVPAFIDALLMMSEGDSATAYMVLDSTMKRGLPETLAKYDEVRFEIAVVDVVTAEEQKKAKEEAAARASGVATAVGAIAKDYTEGKLADKLTTLPSGLKVMVMEKGSGAPVKAGDKVETMYYGCLTNGTRFDDSFSRGEPLGFEVASGGMIAGYDEGVQQLNHGGKGYFFLPYQLAYGEEGSPPMIPAKAELIFYIEVK